MENDFFKNEIDNDYCNYCLDVAKKNKNNLNEKYEIIEKFKICIICNKKEENEKTRKCEICENYLHIKCVKNNICTL